MGMATHELLKSKKSVGYGAI
eukprot:SAG11_NODE_2079_length_3855_cov_1.533280_1_plen_20_part_10